MLCGFDPDGDLYGSGEHRRFRLAVQCSTAPASLNAFIPQTDLSVGVLAVLIIVPSTSSNWQRGHHRGAAAGPPRGHRGKCPASGSSRQKPAWPLAWPGPQDGLGQGGPRLKWAKGRFGSKNDEKVKVLRMEFSIVENLSELQESIFNLS